MAKDEGARVWADQALPVVDKTESQAQPKEEAGDKDDEEKPNWNSSGEAEFSAFDPNGPRGARVPSQGIVCFLEAMTDLVYQYNLCEHTFRQETVEALENVPAELKPFLNDSVCLIPGITFLDWIHELKKVNPWTATVPCLERETVTRAYFVNELLLSSNQSISPRILYEVQLF